MITDQASSVVLDDRAWPIVFATWFGEPTEALVRKYFEVHAEIVQRARSRKERFVLITDTFATERPSPSARKAITDLTAAQPEDIAWLVVKSFVVIESALMRGVLIALQWIYPRMSESENVASIDLAIERALAALDAAGVARPKGWTARDYRRPPRPR